MAPYNVLNKNKILRAGLFERVSTEEQSRFGYSIATQVEALEEHAAKNRMKIVDHYCDAGVSGGIAYKKRPEMMRLLQDVKDGKIDIILFTRLDRWFRNIKEYFKVQEILEEHNDEWKAITTPEPQMEEWRLQSFLQLHRTKERKHLSVFK